MEQERKGLMGGVAKALNATGAGAVKSFDYTVDWFIKVTEAVKKSSPGIVDTTVDLSKKTGDAIVRGVVKSGDYIAGGVSKMGELFSRVDFGSIDFGALKMPELKLGSGKDDLRDKIAEYEGKIKNLYFEIGKEGASEDKSDSDKVRKMIEDVKDYEKEIQRLKARIVELEDLKREESQKKSETKRETAKTSKKKLAEPQVDSLIKSAIEKALKHGKFETDSDKAIFNKIANDLLDMEMDVKILAATELGKMGNKASSGVLVEAVHYDNHYLTAEVINSLINIGDKKAVAICKEMAASSNPKVRMNSLRGLYKLGKEDEIYPYLTDALKDEHADVRRQAVTFLGWKDCAEAVPGLVQSLQDKDESVRKAAVSALANIKDNSAVLPLMRTLADDNLEIRQKSLEAIKMISAKDITFNIELTGEALAKSVSELKDWWQRERMDGISDEVVEQYADVTASPQEQYSYSQTYETPVETSPEAAPEEASSYEEPSAGPQQSASVDSGDETTSATPQTEKPSASEIKRMSKSELISVCQGLGIDCDDTFTKAELINLLNV
ncbi:MAG: HEAT repeat domain-containing protein [Candidatus Magnetominusculus sp. LBB02]|nr:HEAT repeat domain-containing protein [Candidatus Magnetominusculus sp. LBB02]